MYPTTILGLWGLGVALRYAARPAMGTRPMPAILLAVLCSGCLGTITGIIRTLQFLHPHPIDKALKFLFVGTSESLHNMTLALIMITLSVIIVAIGRHRES